jgi:UDPglucose 6-dehydrogenase
MTKVTVIGSGYVGLVTGACLSELGYVVVCLDVDAAKIASLQAGGMPIFEPGLLEMVRRNVAAERLSFTTDVRVAAEHGAIQFIAVGTPPDEDGSADLSYVLAAARNIGRSMTAFTVIVNKSTVPVGTANKVREAVAQELAARGATIAFSVVSNPEFLKEGAAIEDFMRPGRIVVGADDEEGIKAMRALYAPIQRNHDRLIVMDTRAAELTKYAANAMLATRISFMNELANLAGALNVDVEAVRHGIGSDPRIGYDFLYAGCGYGGSCFPKDVKALIRTAKDKGHPMQVLHAVDAANEMQKQIMAHKVMARFGTDLRGKHFALWGLAFKPNTDDMRQAPSRTLIDALLKVGATITAYDPVAMPEARRIYESEPALTFADTPLAALDLRSKADALLIVTEWKEFRAPNFEQVKARLIRPTIVDGRNLYDPEFLRARGFEYIAIGR